MFESVDFKCFFCMFYMFCLAVIDELNRAKVLFSYNTALTFDNYDYFHFIEFWCLLVKLFYSNDCGATFIITTTHAFSSTVLPMIRCFQHSRDVCICHIFPTCQFHSFLLAWFICFDQTVTGICTPTCADVPLRIRSQVKQVWWKLQYDIYELW